MLTRKRKYHYLILLVGKSILKAAISKAGDVAQW
jgi:hypothetical protein